MIQDWRFWKNVSPEPNTGCWIWTGGLNDHGYARITHKSKGKSFTVLISPWSYKRFVGPIPSGHNIRHKCLIRCCVNPDHLTTGTHSQNCMDKPREVRIAMSRHATTVLYGSTT